VDEAVMVRPLQVAVKTHREVMVKDVDKAPGEETRVAAGVELHRRWQSNGKARCLHGDKQRR
jgi:hypothetical protein